MPSITYIDDNQEPSRPDPPQRYNPQAQFNNANPGPRKDDASERDLARIRNTVSAAQIMALVSLVVGGVVLGIVALAFAIRGYRKATGFQMPGRPEVQDILKRSARIALIVSIVALALNAAALIMVYPMLMEMLQTGDYASLFGNPTDAQPTGNSTWG